MREWTIAVFAQVIDDHYTGDGVGRIEALRRAGSLFESDAAPWRLSFAPKSGM